MTQPDEDFDAMLSSLLDGPARTDQEPRCYDRAVLRRP